MSAALLLIAAAMGCGAAAPTRLVDLRAPELTASYGTGTGQSLNGELQGSASVRLSFPEVGMQLHDACPTLAVTVSVNSTLLQVTAPGGPSPECHTEEGNDCSGFCRPLEASGEIGVLDGAFTVAIRDESATFFMSSSNLIQSKGFGLTEPERASAAEPWSVVLSAGAPVHLYRATNSPSDELDDPDPRVPRLILEWNVAREPPAAVQIDPRHVRIPLPAQSATTLPELTPTLTQERPAIETCDGPATCAGTGTASARPFWFWFDYPVP
jgi:hypothetical protein